MQVLQQQAAQTYSSTVKLAVVSEIVLLVDQQWLQAAQTYLLMGNEYG
jgi:hypothetical protein